MAADPPLGDGFSHWVPLAPYKEYVDLYGHQVEVYKFCYVYDLLTVVMLQPNTCDSQLRAADHTIPKSSTVFRASGVGGVLCGRHTLIRKNGMGDLQKGEKYVYCFRSMGKC